MRAARATHCSRSIPLVAVVALIYSRAPVAAYYRYNKEAYRNAVALNHTLARNALVVIGHYGPDVQYYIDRFGWEEDPLLWTPFDEESAIRKGARYFISIEDHRLRRNLELCAWLQRFPVVVRSGALARLRDRLDEGYAASASVLARVSPGRADRRGPQFLGCARPLQAGYGPMTLKLWSSELKACGSTEMLPR